MTFLAFICSKVEGLNLGVFISHFNLKKIISQCACVNKNRHVQKLLLLLCMHTNLNFLENVTEMTSHAVTWASCTLNRLHVAYALQVHMHRPSLRVRSENTSRINTDSRQCLSDAGHRPQKLFSLKENPGCTCSCSWRWPGPKSYNRMSWSGRFRRTRWRGTNRTFEKVVSSNCIIPTHYLVYIWIY